MRTKTLLVAMATLAASLATSMAQVYSQNIVGYINLNLTSGFNLVANQLVTGSNSISQVFPSVQEGTLLYKFLPSGAFSVDYFNVTDGGLPLGWSDSGTGNPSETQLNPGEGFFLNSPAPGTVTLTGSVSTGTNTISLNTGFNLVSSATPESYELVGTNFPATDGMLAYFSNGSGGYDVSYFNVTDGGLPLGWSDSGSGNPVTVQPNVGEGFFINSPGSVNWTRVFNP